MISKNNKIGLSDRLKELRENKGLTQQEFAELLDLSRVSVGAYEKGTAIPNTETLIKISNIFSISLDWLCCTEMNAPKDKYTIKNYKDAFLMLHAIADEFQQIFNVSYDESGFPVDEYAVTYKLSPHVIDGITQSAWVEVCICDEYLHNIFSDFKSMNNLVKKDTISKKLYSSWFEGFCKKLADVPTPKHELDDFQDEHIKRTVFESNLEDMKTKIKIRMRDIEKKEELNTSEIEELNTLKAILSEQIKLEKIMNETDNRGETNGNSTKKG